MLANCLKVFLLMIAAFTSAERSRALSLVYPPRNVPMFVPKRYHSRVLFLDEDEFGRGEIDLTDKRKTERIKFDETPDYEFTSDDDKSKAIDGLSHNERFYEPRFRGLYPKLYQGRYGRTYAPSFSFEPYVQMPYAPPRNSFYAPTNGWRARSPRVVFPYAPDTGNSIHTNSHSGPSLNDNVVFREQSIGTNDVAPEDQLQDIAGDAFTERDANDPHRAQKIYKRMEFKTKTFYVQKIPFKLQKPMFVQMETKLPYIKRISYEYPNSTQEVPEFKPISDAQITKIHQIFKDVASTKSVPQSTNSYRQGRNLDSITSDTKIIESVTDIPEKDRKYEDVCPQGGTCEFFLSCWMKGGLLEGSCGGLLKSCCHRVAKSGILGVQDSNSIESPFEGFSYGPVINDESCGVAVGKQTAQRRIVGGDDAGFGTFPWQAYIRIGSSRCGGSLISRRHVVTAGHCVARAQPRHVRVTLGDYVINSAAEPLPAYTFGVRSIKVHPLFKFTPQADRFDVAVLTLDRSVHYMPHIAPICLPERGSDFLGQYGWAAGWGALSPGSRLRPRTLQAVDVPVLDNRVCERWHRANGINVVIYPEMLCAGYRGGGKDSCQGDSGGPLMLERAGRWYLIGVVSAGYSCASRGQPGIYHRVAHTVDWISHATTLP
ncbi:coagulation factor VII isoform X2 [Zerene cesonia]|uniref:coagulation factor VII isoform X2 n=1 Tax=Zerene cesonia TaxID=33412 RepID=UPI0018E4DC84|nr:coagulation factor VII isoform X2 [Zerene cesonia]